MAKGFACHSGADQSTYPRRNSVATCRASSLT